MKIDAKGLPCPQPVLKVRDSLNDHPSIDDLEIDVDNQAASENVSRFLESQGFSAYILEKNGIYTVVTGSQSNKRPSSDERPIIETPSSPGEKKRTLIMITSNTLGRSDDTLGQNIMVNFLKTLPEMGDNLWRICFLNGGVLLCIQGAEALEAIMSLEKKGASILVCGGCLEHYKKLDQKRVGQTTNMLDIVTSLDLADKIINI